MDKIDVELGDRRYPIYIGANLLGDKRLLARSVSARQALIVTNETVAPLYLDELRAQLSGATEVLVLPDGERHKTLATFAQIIDRLIESSFHRDAAIIALGGGVIGDVAGFAAASYQRGISLIQCPTTLLSQVDSSVGGKTAVNHPRAKNMIGAFYQPAAVIADISTLSSLPAREFAAGMAEVIKYGLICDAEFFDWLEKNMVALRGQDPDLLTYAIRRCCEIKAEIVADDEHERGRRALLNLGHTFGHALEAMTGYGTLLHGEAVAIGMSMAAMTSVQLGMLDSDVPDRVDALLVRAGLPVSLPAIDTEKLMAHMKLDKKAGAGGLKLILLEAIGRAQICTAPDAATLAGILSMHGQARE